MFGSCDFRWLALWFRQAGKATRQGREERVAENPSSWEEGWQGSRETEGESENKAGVGWRSAKDAWQRCQGRLGQQDLAVRWMYVCGVETARHRGR